MTDRENLAFLLATSPSLDLVDGRGYEQAADDLIANGVTVQKWIPVAERLPEADGDYLVWNNFHKAIVGHYWSKGRYFISKAVTVTHWMKLPEPPKGE